MAITVVTPCGRIGRCRDSALYCHVNQNSFGLAFLVQYSSPMQCRGGFFVDVPLEYDLSETNTKQSLRSVCVSFQSTCSRVPDIVIRIIDDIKV
jgi:hypothetical protein